MNMIPAPRSRSTLSSWNRCCVFSDVSEALGSSRMKTVAFCRTARTISTLCRVAVPRFSTSASAPTLRDWSDCVAAMLVLPMTMTQMPSTAKA